MKTTIIIPNYNGLSFMEPCFEALEKQTTKDFKILVVDNGSTDGSVEWLKEREIPSIFLPENTGFSGAVNVGIRAADTPYVILLNNDTKVAPHYVEALERAMDRSEKIFSVSSKMIQMYHPDLMDDAGDMYSVLGWAFQRGVGRPENYKNMRTWQLLLNSPCLLAGTFVKFLFFKKMGFGKDYVSGFLEGIRTLKDCKRVPSFKGRIQREIGIQLELIAGTAVYVYEFSRRQAAKLGAKS